MSIPKKNYNHLIKQAHGLKILDIIAGGLISEPMANLGADVTGIDASENIKVAKIMHKKIIL